MKIYIDRLEAGENTLQIESREILEIDFGDTTVIDAEDFELKILRRQDYLYVTGESKIKLNLFCDRCGDVFDREYPINIDFTFFIGYPDKDSESDDIIEYITPKEKIFDFSPYYKEAMYLSLPYLKLCQEECKGACPKCGANLNAMDCGCEIKKQIDPRWEKLAEISKKMKENKN